jgi:hypothetical protein
MRPTFVAYISVSLSNFAVPNALLRARHPSQCKCAARDRRGRVDQAVEGMTTTSPRMRFTIFTIRCLIRQTILYHSYLLPLTKQHISSHSPSSSHNSASHNLHSNNGHLPQHLPRCNLGLLQTRRPQRVYAPALPPRLPPLRHRQQLPPQIPCVNTKKCHGSEFRQ